MIPKILSSGKVIDLSNFKYMDVDINDILTSLENMLRFDGHYKDRKPLSVLQHSILTYNLSKILTNDRIARLCCLLHDIHECVIGDIGTPSKKFFKINDNNEFLYELLKHFNISKETFIKYEDIVNEVDSLSADIERRNMWKESEGDYTYFKTQRIIISLEDAVSYFDEVSKYDRNKFLDILK